VNGFGRQMNGFTLTEVDKSNAALLRAEPDDALDVKRMLALLRRRRRLIILIVVFGTVAGTWYGVQRTPLYTAQALVVLDPQRSELVNTDKLGYGLQPDDLWNAVQTEIKIIESPLFTGKLVDELKLAGRSEFAPSPETAPSVLTRLQIAVQDAGRWLNERWLATTSLAKGPPEMLEARDASASDPEMEAREQALWVVQEGLKAMPVEESYVLAINYTSSDPQTAAMLANGAAKLYMDEKRETKLRGLDRASSWMNERLHRLRDELLAAERRVEQFRAANKLGGTKSDEEQSLGDQTLIGLNQQLVAARAALAEKQAKLRLLRRAAADSNAAADRIADMVESPVLASLRNELARTLQQQADISTTFGGKHPRIIGLQEQIDNIKRQIRREIERTINGFETEVELASASAASLESQVDQFNERSMMDRTVEVRLRELEREAEATRELYQTLLGRFKETVDQQGIVESDIQMIAPAVLPNRPSTASSLRFTLVGFTGSLLLGTLLSLLIEHLQVGLRATEETERLFGLPALGTVPYITAFKRRQAPQAYLKQKPLSAYSEAIRSIYASVQVIGTDRPRQVVLVTSSVPGEGKTTLATSLAASAAMSNKRTVLVDLDIRQRMVGAQFGHAPASGLVEYLTGEARLEDAIHTDPESNIDYIPVKQRVTNPTALLSSARMYALMEELRRSYDFIVLDTTPLLGISDAQVASGLADICLLAVKWGSTREKAVENAVRQLRFARAPVAGVVFQQANTKDYNRYNYDSFGRYYSSYRKYYVD
jgi:polysaccharide biosynthesis transport protein